ncbi:PucR family transcriptional regulator [Sporichthya polymorpha]|uniref:PucR family transcriptional regulator n=1 Tax=Sporichthya polymorpha TaxID=35751 RepID=UPI000375A2AD|nr:helix-turn-helix domain-containing protein [Sporichthya polymorpha]
MGTPAEVSEWAARVATQLTDLGPELSTHIMATVHEMPQDAEMHAATETNAIAHIGAMAALLRFGIPPEGIEAPAQATDFARLMVHRGVALPTLLRCYHVGQAKLWRQWVDVVFENVNDPDELKRLVTWSTDFVSTYLDAVRVHVVAAYEDERRRWERSQAAAAEDAIRGVLAGQAVDSDEASRRMRHELRRHHVAVVLRPDPVEEPSAHVAALEGVVRQIAEILGAGQPLLMRATDRSVCGWVSSVEAPGATALEALEDCVLPPNCRGAFGNPGYGLDGFRESHLQARQALRAAGSRLVSFAATGFGSTLLADPESAARFATAELGALAGAGATTARLRETLEAYLAEGASHKRAAARLTLHEKTVEQRVRRAEELLGRPLAGRRAAVEAALLIHRLLDA